MIYVFHEVRSLVLQLIFEGVSLVRETSIINLEVYTIIVLSV